MDYLVGQLHSGLYNMLVVPLITCHTRRKKVLQEGAENIRFHILSLYTIR